MKHIILIALAVGLGCLLLRAQDEPKQDVKQPDAALKERQENAAGEAEWVRKGGEGPSMARHAQAERKQWEGKDAAAKWATAAGNKEKAQLIYNDLLAKLKSGDAKIDYTALRTSFAEMTEYHYNGISKDERAKMFKSLNDKNFEDALKQADNISEKNYIDANVHYAAYQASKELKDDKNAEFHKAVFVGLLNSIQNGNDGKTAKTAFLPINISEEYNLINFLGYKLESQSTVQEDGHRFDIMSVVNTKTNDKAKFYFNIDKIWEAETKLFGGSSPLRAQDETKHAATSTATATPTAAPESPALLERPAEEVQLGPDADTMTRHAVAERKKWEEKRWYAKRAKEKAEAAAKETASPSP